MCAARSTRIAERVSDVLGVPRDVALDLPRLSLEGNVRLVLENHKGIIEFSADRLRVQTTAGQVSIVGRRLVLRGINRERIVVEGRFDNLEFLGWEVS
ncbi:MAG: YabP/YqfC family sporulation protein [Firmicutes bacterium]|jgi:sporulation protein YqfC|nr:YabP/YqfC family sporulation protein [Bacillota bacterium]MDD4337335.1 YabP/YqfC family sporulation protein [Bacillota bacterium]